MSTALSPHRFAVGVTDHNREEPLVVPGPVSRTAGRGLQVVASLSRDWGIRLVHEYSKTVWATLNRPQPRNRSSAGER